MSVSLFSMRPVPVSEKSQEIVPPYVAVPATASGTEVPSSRPDAVPTTVILPAHVAEKLPVIELDVALVTCHWKLLQDPDEDTPGNSDVHVPAYEPDPADGAGADGVLGVVPGVVGSRTSELLSKRAHAVENVGTAASIASRNKALFMVVSRWRQAIRKRDYKLVLERTKLCVQHPEIIGNPLILTTRS